MEWATLLLSGVPRYVSLADLSYHLDILFNTDDIGTFKARDLPNHPQTNQRQVALDFMSSYDAMVAQEKLEGYQYEMQDGRQYTLRAKINKHEEYMQSERSEWLGNSCNGTDWPSMALIPSLDGEAYHRANARLDAQLDLLRKQCRVIEKEKELLREKRRLRREYGSMVSSFCQYEVPSRSWMEQSQLKYIERGYDESEASSQRSRSRSRDYRSGSWHRRSRSRDRHGDRSSRYRSRSKERAYKYPQIEWHDVERSGSYGKRSRQPREFRDRSSSQDSFHRAERSPERKRLRELRSVSIEHTAQSKDRSLSKDKRSRSKDNVSEELSRRDRGNSLRRFHRDRSMSRERRTRHRSRERIVSSSERSRERHFDDRMSRLDWYRRRSRSTERRAKPLAIMPTSKRNSPKDRTIILYEDDHTFTPEIIKQEADIQKKTSTNKGKDDDNSNTNENKTNNIIENKTIDVVENKSKPKSKEEKNAAKFNSKIKKAEMLHARVKEFTKEVMVVIKILLEDIITKNNIVISASDKESLVKDLKALVEARVEPLARRKKNTGVEVLVKYMELYPEERDSAMIKGMLANIAEMKMVESETTTTVSSKQITQDTTDPVILDVQERESKRNHKTDLTRPENVIPLETIENLPKTAQESVTIDSDGEKSSPLAFKEEKTLDVEEEENTKEKDVVIDLDSANKRVPRNPQFVVVIKTLCKQMNKTGRLHDLLGKERVNIREFKYVLKDIIRNLLKGQGYLPRAQIIYKFREIYPICNDKEFVNNIIQDIKDGKYPGCLDHIDIITDDDQHDEVIFIEKQYDTVTLSDSEDEDKQLEVVQNTPCPLDSSQNILETSIHPNSTEVNSGQIKVEQDSNVSQEAVMPVTKQLSTQEQPRAATTIHPDKLNLQSEENEEAVENGDKTSQSEKDNAKNDYIGDKQHEREMVKDNTSQIASDDINDSHPDKNDHTEKIQGHETDQFIDNPAQNNINTKENTKENDSNDLRVTAITIVTSLSDLLTKTTNEPKDEINDIKEELEYEEEKLDESSLQLVPDNDPKVTSITIMTSDAELFSIGQDSGKKVSDIKNEDIYDPEESLLNDIKRDIENDEFTLQMDDHSLNTQEPIEQNYSVIDPNCTSNELNSTNISQTNDDDDETNESIRRYVASLL